MSDHSFLHPTTTELLRPDVFASLARRCGFEVRRDDFAALREYGYLQPLEIPNKGPHYSSGQLWILARYMRAVSVPQHPWLSSAPRPHPDTLQSILEDADVLVRWLECVMENMPLDQTLAVSCSALLKTLRNDRRKHDPIRPLRSIFPLLRMDARASCTGAPLLAEFILQLEHNLTESLRSLRSSSSGVFQRPSISSGTYAVPQTTSGAVRAISRPVQTISRPVQTAQQPVAPSPEPTPPPKTTAQPTSSPSIPSFSTDEIDGNSTMLFGSRPSNSTPTTAPPAEPAQPPEPTKPPEPTLEERIQELNTLRERYIKDQDWTSLVALYRDKINLFKDTTERRKIITNIGVIYELKLEEPENALKAYTDAAKLGVDAELFDSIDRVSQSLGRFEHLVSIISALIKQSSDRDLVAVMGQRKAQLLALHLDRYDDALQLFANLLRLPATEEQYNQSAQTIVAVIEDPKTPASFTLPALKLFLTNHAKLPTTLLKLPPLYTKLYTSLLNEKHTADALQVATHRAQLHDHLKEPSEAFTSLCNVLEDIEKHPSITHHTGLFQDLHTRALSLDLLDDLALALEDAIDAAPDTSTRLAVFQALSLVHRDRGDTKASKRILQNIADLDPEDPRASELLLTVLDDASPEHLSTLEALRDRVDPPKRPDILLQIVQIRTAGLYPHASDWQRDALDLDQVLSSLDDLFTSLSPDDPRTANTLSFADTLLQHAPTEYRLLTIRLLEQYTPSHVTPQRVLNVYTTLAQHYLESEDHSEQTEAIPLFQRAAHIQEHTLQDPAAATRTLGRALLLQPNTEDLHANFVRLYTASQQWLHAADLLEDVLEHEDLQDPLPTLLALADLYTQHLDDPTQAASTFARVLQHNPRNQHALLFLQEHYASSGLWDEWANTQSTYTQHLDDPETLTSVQLQSTKLLLQAQRPDLAQRFALALLDRDKEDPERIKNLSLVYNDASSGIAPWAALLQRHLPNMPSSPLKHRLQYRLAVLLDEQLAAPNEAIQLLQDLQDDPDLDPSLQLTALRLTARIAATHQKPFETYSALQRLLSLLETRIQDRQLDSDELQSLNEELDTTLQRLASLAENSLHSPEEATEHLQAFLGRNPSHLPTIQSLSRLYNETEDWPGLFSTLQHHADHIRSHDNNPQTLAILLERLVSVARTKLQDPHRELEALAILTKTRAKARPTDLERMSDLARSLELWDDCFDYSEQYISTLSAPEDIAAMLVELADLALNELDDVERACTYLERALQHHPSDSAAIKILSAVYRTQKSYEKLAALWQSLLDHDDILSPLESISLYRDLARLLEQHLDQPYKAAGLLERALGLADAHPNTPDSLGTTIRKQLAILYRELQDPISALTHLQVIERNSKPNSSDSKTTADLYTQLGLTAQEAGQDKLSMRYLRQALELDPYNALVKLKLAQHLVQDNTQGDEGCRLLEALAARPDDLPTPQDRGQAFASLGLFYGRIGKVGKAVDMFRTALKHDPENEAALKAMG